MAAFDAPAGDAPSASRVEEELRSVLSPDFLSSVPLPLVNGKFETLAAALAVGLREASGSTGLPWRSTRDGQGRCRVYLGYLDAEAAGIALQTGLNLALALLRAMRGRRGDLEALGGQIPAAAAAIARRHPDPLMRALQRVARRRGIPVLPVSAKARVWQFGHGCAGIHFFEVGTEADSLTGTHLARDKQQSNQFVERLGFPGVNHVLVDGLENARRAAAQLGFPLVLKPLDRGKGLGVTVGVTTPEQLDAAWKLANEAAPGRVLVESFVPGDDHRLVVIGGAFAWAVRRSPPRIIADGNSTIAALVDAENARRRQAPNPEIAGTRIVLDDDALAVLATQDLTPASRPAAGTTVDLGRVANIARGGTLADCTAQIHPDNIAMAEAVARGMRLDAVGLDFITPDITRSWREVRCAVLEVNTTPGFSSDERAELILERRFPAGRDGRIPAVLLAGASEADLAQVVAVLADRGLRVGWSSGTSSGLGDALRFAGKTSLAERAAGLVLDPACQALVLSATSGEIAARGLPLERFDLAVVRDTAGLSAATMQLLRDCSAQLRPGVATGELASVAREALEALAP